MRKPKTIGVGYASLLERLSQTGSGLLSDCAPCGLLEYRAFRVTNSMEDLPGLPDQSALTPANFTTLAHFSVSSGAHVCAWTCQNSSQSCRRNMAPPPPKPRGGACRPYNCLRLRRRSGEPSPVFELAPWERVLSE